MLRTTNIFLQSASVINFVNGGCCSCNQKLKQAITGAWYRRHSFIQCTHCLNSLGLGRKQPDNVNSLHIVLVQSNAKIFAARSHTKCSKHKLKADCLPHKQVADHTRNNQAAAAPPTENSWC